jgi:hypothetical protein
MAKRLTPGMWVRSYSPGVWQVYRVLRGFNELRYSLADPKERSKSVFVFSKRLVTEKWQRSFRSESCDSSFVKPLAARDLRRVEALLRDESSLASAFDAYQPAPIDLIVNLSMNVPDRSQLQSFCEDDLRSRLQVGLDHDRILALLQEAGLAAFVGKMPINATLQLTCRDHEIRDSEFVFRDCSVLPF